MIATLCKLGCYHVFVILAGMRNQHWG